MLRETTQTMFEAEPNKKLKVVPSQLKPTMYKNDDHRNCSKLKKDFLQSRYSCDKIDEYEIQFSIRNKKHRFKELNIFNIIKRAC